VLDFPTSPRFNKPAGILSITDLPVVAQMTIQTDGTPATALPETFTNSSMSGADVIGLNCSVGPTRCSKPSRKCAM
jgi:methionine synthase I (cobalamin-dependent)